MSANVLYLMICINNTLKQATQPNCFQKLFNSCNTKGFINMHRWYFNPRPIVVIHYNLNHKKTTDKGIPLNKHTFMLVQGPKFLLKNAFPNKLQFD